MTVSHGEMEERLIHALYVFAEAVPDSPPEPWSTTWISPPTSAPASRRHFMPFVGVAASVVLIALASILWADPSAGAGYHGSGISPVGYTFPVPAAHPLHLGTRAL